MKTTLFTFLAFVFALQVLNIQISNSQVGPVWLQRYNGTADSTDYANKMAVDTSGNVYVTGSSKGGGTSYDYVTIKYNSEGMIQWLQRYNGPGNGADFANSIAVDASGNVYITGGSVGSGSGSDVVTIKYNTLGVQQWLQRYNGTENAFDDASSITVDASGNVYVAGSSMGSGTSYDYVTIKYNSSGVQQWMQRYDGTGSSFDAAFSIAVDGSGNVSVAGYSTGVGTGYDCVTIQYNSSGVQQWLQRYNGPGNSTDVVNSIAVDGSGNVYITGFSGGSGTANDYVTIKYNSSGVQQWLQTYNGTGNSFDNAKSLTIDGSGNVYITGYSTGSSSGEDYTTIKYNSSGVQQWLQIYNGAGNSHDNAYSIAIDAPGNVYVTGFSSGNATGNDYTTIKYNSSGVQEWEQRYNGPAGTGDEAYSIAVDGSGNVYITGGSRSGTTSDYTTIKYSQTLGIQNTGNEIPENFSLGQNYPNPFNPVTNIEFSLPKGSFTKIIIYDIAGRKAAELVNQNLQAGTYKVDFDASHLSSGTYFYRLTAGDHSIVKKMILVK
jgi:uncharacterized delta-60 repeat protein